MNLNKVKSVIALMLFLVFTAFVLTCNAETKKSDNPLSNLQGNTFKSSAPKMEVKALSGWTIIASDNLFSATISASKTEIERLEKELKTIDKNKEPDKYKETEQTLSELKENTMGTEEALKAKESVISLFYASKSKDDKNFTISCKAYVKKQFTGINTADAFLKVITGNQENTQPLKSVSIGGKTFKMLELPTSSHNKKMVLRQYCAIIDDFYLTFSAMYPSENAEEINNFMKNIIF